MSMCIVFVLSSSILANVLCTYSHVKQLFMQSSNPDFGSCTTGCLFIEMSSFQGVLIKGLYCLTISHAYTGLSEEDSGAEEGSWLSNRGNYDRIMNVIITENHNYFLDPSLYKQHPRDYYR